jgi:hypothetical protein
VEFVDHSSKKVEEKCEENKYVFLTEGTGITTTFIIFSAKKYFLQKADEKMAEFGHGPQEFTHHINT